MKFITFSHNRLCLLLVFSILCFLTTACKKSQEETVPLAGDSLGEEDNAFLESIGIPTPALKDILGRNGNPGGRLATTTLETDVNEIVKKMLTQAQMLCMQKESVKYASEGVDKPEHIGLAYSFGQRDISARKTPPLGNAIHKKFAVYGTDCSGFVYNVLIKSGVSIDKFVCANFEEKIQSYLQRSGLTNEIRLKNLGYKSINELKSGDFILWLTPNGNHMGMFYRLTNGTLLFQSNGTGTPDDISQLKNLGSKRGVRTISFDLAVNGKGYWGSGYQVIRLQPTSSLNLLSGNNQSALPNSSLSNPLIVKVLDVDDKPISGINIQWNPSSGSGNLTSVITKTDSKGEASANWRLGAKEGVQTVLVTAANSSGKEIMGSPLIFNADAKTNPLIGLTKWAGYYETAPKSGYPPGTKFYGELYITVNGFGYPDNVNAEWHAANYNDPNNINPVVSFRLSGTSNSTFNEIIWNQFSSDKWLVSNNTMSGSLGTLSPNGAGANPFYLTKK